MKVSRKFFFILLVLLGQTIAAVGMPQQYPKSVDINTKAVADAVDDTDEASLEIIFHYDEVNDNLNNPIKKGSESSYNPSPLGEGKNEVMKNVLIDADKWSSSSVSRETEEFFNLQSLFGSSKKEIARALKKGDVYHDDDSIGLVVGIKRNVQVNIDVKSIISSIISQYNVNIINEVSIEEEPLAFIMDVPYQTLQSFTSAVETLDFISYIEPNMRFEICFTPNDPDWRFQWGPKKIEVSDAWDIQQGSSDVLVAVIDTGIDWDHPDLATNYVPLGYDWVNDDADPMDDNGHGTHCAGVIAAILNNSVGIAGLAQVQIMAEKGLDSSGSGWSDDLANSIIHAVDQGAKVLSNSWGSYGASSLIQDAVQYAQDHGVLVLAAAGNSGSNERHYPAAFDEVVAVTATDSSDLPASFTNYGEWVEVSAPGVEIYSTVWDDSYTNMSGTSMSTPHAAGVAALIWSQYPEMSLNEVRNHLKFATDDLGPPGFDEYYGHGRINVLKAIHPPPPHELLILSHEAPYLVEIGGEVRVNTTVFNYGTSNETNVEVQLLVNGTLQDNYTITFLITGASETVHLSWNSLADAIYNITSYIVPIPDENNTANNAASTLMRSCIPVEVLWDDVHDDDGDALHGNYFSLFKTLSLQGYAVTEHVNGTIDSTLLSNYSILVLLDPEIDFSTQEISDIQSWVSSGGKLLVIPDAGWLSTLNDLLAPYGIQVTPGRSGADVTTDIAYHPITENVESIYYNAAYDLDVDPSRAIALAWTTEPYELLSVSDNVVVLSDSNLMDNSHLGREDNERLMTNIFDLIGVRLEHDLSVSVDAPAWMYPGNSSMLNVTVHNLGLHNEIDVEFTFYIDSIMVNSSLVPILVNGSSYTLSHVWTPLTEGIYNLTAYASPVAGENVTVNNMHSIDVRSVVVPEMQVALFKNNDPWGYIPNEEVLSFYGIPYDVYSSTDFGSADLEIYDKVIIASDQDQSFYTEMDNYAWWFEEYVARGGLLEIHAADAGWNGGRWTGVLPGGLGWKSSYSDYVTIVNATHPVVTKPFLISDEELDGWGSSVHGYFDIFPVWSQIVIHEDSTSQPAYIEFSYGRGTMIASSQTLERAYSHRYSNILENSILYKPKAHTLTHDFHVSLQSPNYLLFGESSQLDASVYNLGLFNETDVKLFLLIDGNVVSSLNIPLLENGTSQAISYQWTPTATGRYNVTAYTLPVPDENFTANNFATRWTSVTDILVYTDDAFTVSSQRYSIVALDNLGIAYVHYSDDPSGFGTALTSYPWSLVIVDHNNYFAVGDYWNELEAYVLGGGCLILSTFDMDGSHSETTTLWDTLGAEWVSDITSPEPVYRWAPTHPIFTIPNEVGDLTSYVDGYFDNGDHIRPTTGTPLAGFTPTLSENATSIVLGDSAKTLLMSFILSEFPDDEDADGKLDAVELWENAITYISTPLEHDLKVSLEAPLYLLPGGGCLLNVTVSNIGLEDESDVTVRLLVNGTTIQDEIILTLINKTSTTLSYPWNPAPGWYNVTAYVEPAPNENYTINNRDSEWVDVSYSPRHVGDIVVDGDDVLVIEGVYFTQIGNIYVRDHATLVIRNATLNLDQETWRQYQIMVSDSAVLMTEDAYIVSEYYFDTLLVGYAEGWLNSTFFGDSWDDPPVDPIGYIDVEDEAILNVHGSTLGYLYCYDYSMTSIYGSDLIGLFSFDNTLVSVYESDIEWNAYISPWGSSDVLLEGCTLGYPRIGFLGSSSSSAISSEHAIDPIEEIGEAEGRRLQAYIEREGGRRHEVDDEAPEFLDEEWGRLDPRGREQALKEHGLRSGSASEGPFYVASSAVVTLTGLHPGYIGFWNIHVNETVSGVDWNLTLVDTDVTEGWELSGFGDSEISVHDSTLSDLNCYDDSKVSVYDSTIEWSVYVSPWGSSDVLLEGCTLNEMSLSFFDYSTAVLTDLRPGYIDFWNIHVNGTVTGVDWDLTLVDTTVTNGWGISCYYDSEVSIYNSTLNYLSSFDYSEVSIHDSTLLYLYSYDSSTVSVYDSIIYGLDCYWFTGRLNLNRTTVNGWWDIYYSQFYLWGGVNFTEVDLWFWNSEVTRNYGVEMTLDGSPYPGVALTLYDEWETPMWSGLTDSSGHADFNVTYTDDNYTAVCSLRTDDYPLERDVELLSDTPITLNTGGAGTRISFLEGWNLIGIPYDLADPSIEGVFNDNLTHIQSIYGYYNGTWSYWFPGIHSTLHDLECGTGYWVQADAPFNTTLSGTTGQAPPLCPEWNLIGVNGTDPVPLEDFLGQIPWVVKYVYGYKAGDWTYYIKGIGGELDTLHPGDGYWVYCET